MLLIGLNGRMRSGKDTAVEYIREEANHIFQASQRREAVVERAGFADKLKLSAARSLGFDPSSVEDAVMLCDLLKEGTVTSVNEFEWDKTITGREYLQRYGTESHRDIFGDNFWIDALLPLRYAVHDDASRHLRPIDDLFLDVDVLVVTDCRFENEAFRIRELGGEVWYIEAEGRLGGLPEDSHPSEHPLPQELITRTIRNNDTLEDFRSAVSFATVEALNR